ncbi:MAG: transcriptional repressor [Bacteroidales bacterium]|nr:transcriptional repressor [Bacteroidales bacterium]MDD4217787.1 transcriptional repressor [Bacteroidales bacterium]MDY0140262.1 transcriptional repressor [Bacteroidales bacterium]
MANKNLNIFDKIKNSGLKLTTQRMTILEAVYDLGNHPTTDEIIKYVQTKNPAISQGTIYKTLETFVENKIINKVEKAGGVFRYDGITQMHHHLFEDGSQRIDDYYDEDLNNILIDYFNKNKIPGFQVHHIKLNIKGEFKS